MPEAEMSTISVTRDVAESIIGKVQSGAYSTASDVVRESLAALDARDDDLERWLQDEVVSGHAEYMADPSQIVPAEDVMKRIKARRTAT